MTNDITTTTITNTLANSQLPELSQVALFDEEFRYIEGNYIEGAVYSEGLYNHLFNYSLDHLSNYALFPLEQRLEQQREFLTGAYFNDRLLPHIRQLAQPATQEQVKSFVIGVIAGRTKVSKDDKDIYMVQLPRMVSDQQPMGGALEIAAEELFKTSDGFLPAPIEVNKALEAAANRIRIIAEHVNQMPQIYEQTLEWKGAEPEREREREKVAAEWKRKQEEREAADLVEAQAMLRRFNESEMAAFGRPYPTPHNLLEWYRKMKKR
jgi:hypothetical protein